MDHVLEITVGGGDNAYINFDGYGAAHTGDLFFLNGAQQLCLESKGGSPTSSRNSVPFWAVSHRPVLPLCWRAGEDPFVAEQL